MPDEDLMDTLGDEESFLTDAQAHQTEELDEDMADEPYDAEEISDVDDVPGPIFPSSPSIIPSSSDDEDEEPRPPVHPFSSTPGPDGILRRYYTRHFHDDVKKTPGGVTPYMRTKAAEIDSLNPAYPFAGVLEWDFARWLGTSGLSGSKIDELLNLSWVSCSFQL